MLSDTLSYNKIMKMIELKEVKKTYTMGEVKIPALAGINFSIEEGKVAVIVGNSGAGKSTIKYSWRDGSGKFGRSICS